MRKVFVALVGLTAAAALVAPGSFAIADEALDSDIAAIHEVWETYSTARVAGDADLWLSLWDVDGIQMPPGLPARGLDKLKVGVPKGFAAVQAPSMNIHPEETEVVGDWAYCMGTYDVDQVVQGNDVHIEGKFLTIFKRQDDGAWKIYRDIFNSNTS